MSVISLSSEDEEECLVLDSDDEESTSMPLQTQQVFIVENVPREDFGSIHPNSTKNLEEENVSYSGNNKIAYSNENSATENYNEVSLQRNNKEITRKHTLDTNCHTLPITSKDNNKKSGRALQVLAEKLAHFLGSNNHLDFETEQFNKLNYNKEMSSLEKTISDVSKGFFTISSRQTNSWGANKMREADRSLSKMKNIKRKRTGVQTKKEDLKLDHKVVLNTMKKSVNHIKSNKSPSPKQGIDGSYDNKLKFTFDRSISVYSVSVVSPPEPQPAVKVSCQNDQNLNDVGNPIEISRLPSQISVQQITKDFEVTKPVLQTSIHNDDGLPELQNLDSDFQPETLASDDFRSSPIPFSNILDLKSSFFKYKDIVFDDKTNLLCNDMGCLLLQTIEESKKLLKLMETPYNDLNGSKQSPDFIFVSEELKTAVKTCQDALQNSKRNFIKNFSQIHNQINLSDVVGTQLKIVLVTAWFVKMFLNITKKFPEYVDKLHEIKFKTLEVLSEEIVRWPLICKTFIKDESQFDCDCLLVLQFILDSLNDDQSQVQNHFCCEKNTTSPGICGSEDTSKEAIESNHKRKMHEYDKARLTKISKPNAMQYTTNQLQKSKQKETRESVQSLTPPSCLVSIEDKTKQKMTSKVGDNLIVDNNPKTNTEECLVRPPTRDSLQETKPISPTVQNSVPKVCFQYGISPETCDNIILNHVNSQIQSSRHHEKIFIPSNLYGQQNIQYYSYQPNVLNRTTTPSKYSQNYYSNEVYYQESSANQNQITTPPTTLSSFQDSFFPKKYGAINTNREQLPVRRSIEISSCPIGIRTSAYSVCNMGNTGVTINNYNISNYPPNLSPELFTSYNDLTTSNEKRKEQLDKRTLQ